MTADDRVRRVAAAGHFTQGRLEAARDAAESAIGVRSGSPSLWHRVESRIGHLLGSLFPNLSLNPGSSLVGLLGWGLLLALVVGALWYGAVWLVRGTRPNLRRRSTGGAFGAVGAPLPYADARASALGLAATNPREALRQLYAATLTETARRQGWRPRPGQSNWWFVRRLGASTTPGSALADCTRLFEQRVYGSAPTAEADVHRVDQLARVVLA
jgi:Domain of unknown function (DUF4129)